jgi:tetratricopeptide (TPR) repeat protein
MKAFLCEWLITCVLAAPGVRTPDELAYGNVLFAYFQEDYTGALVESLIAEQRGVRGTDPARFVLAQGSLAFAEGLHRMSDDAFASLDPAALQEIDRMRLSFHRARAHYRDGDWPAMSMALEQIRFEPGWFGRERQHPEVAFMRAEAALAAGDFATAERYLGMLESDQDHLGYGLFNLAVAQRAAGDPAAAHATLERLADLPLASQPGRDLVQRGRLAYAVTTGEVADPLDAQAVLARLPAAGRYRDRALAAYGKLAMSRADYALAARIWLTLQERRRLARRSCGCRTGAADGARGAGRAGSGADCLAPRCRPVRGATHHLAEPAERGACSHDREPGLDRRTAAGAPAGAPRRATACCPPGSPRPSAPKPGSPGSRARM